MVKLKQWFSSWDRQHFFRTLLVIACCFGMLAVYWNMPFFETDEGEIYLLGHSIANGRLLYGEIASQHTPVMYYIAALFSLLGASTTEAFRFCFYFLFSLIWGAMYYRYGRVFDHKKIALYPILYILLIGTIEMGHAVLSDQIQGIGMVILLLEMLLFAKEHKLSATSLVFISFAIFISFGSAFVALFSIFFVALTVFALEIVECAKQKLSFGKSIGQLWRKFWKLILVVMLPFVVLAVFYLATGTLDDFWGWAYRINREVYPKYNGYGQSILMTMFSGITNYLGALILTSFTIPSLVNFFVAAGAIYFLVDVQKKYRSWILTLGIFMMMAESMTRGVFNFHGLPGLALLCAMDAHMVIDLLRKAKKSTFKQSVVVFMCICLAVPFVQTIPSLGRIPSLFQRDMSKPDGSMSSVIDLLAEENEIVGFATHQNETIYEANVLPTRVNPFCIWYWEFAGEEAMQEYREDPPKLFLYDRTSATWGYEITDYAADLDAFILENYEQRAYPTLYVRNDCLDEVDAILNSADIPLLKTELSEDNATLTITLKPGAQYESVRMPIWSDENGQDDIVWYEADLNDRGEWVYVVNLANHGSTGKIHVHVYADGININATSLIIE